MSTIDIISLTATELSAAIHSRYISCVEVLDVYLIQIEKLNPEVNTIVACKSRDEHWPLVVEREQQIAKGQSLGALYEFPQAPKDLMPVRGRFTTLGSPIFKNKLTMNDGVVSERIRASGAIFIGRTNTPEFG